MASETIERTQSRLQLTKQRSTPQWWAKALRQIAFYVVLLLVWHKLATSNLWSPGTFAGPLDVWHTLVERCQDGTLIIAITISLRRLAIGYAISLVLGLILGLLIGLNRYLDETLGSLILGLQALPSVCWTPFALLWFGLSEQAMIFVVVMGALFSIALGVDAGIKNTPPIYMQAARNMGTHGLALATQVILPAALPNIIVGLKQGWSFAWRSLMAAELIYVTLSLGGLLEDGRDYVDASLIFAIMLVIIVLGVLINSLLFGPLERVVRLRWGLQQ
jgi:NitT/TauT family transport system permease protein